MTPDDARMVARLVGFLEYGKALQNFDTLISTLTEYEREAVDELVKERDEFAVYTNLSRGLQRVPSSLAEVAGAGDRNDFQQRGLAWVMALARVELGAMLAGFTHVPSPFEAVRPSQYEMLQYIELLQDGARTHFWALRNDPALRQVARLSPQRTEVLSYSRRLVITRAMLRAALGAGIRDYTPLQLRELAYRLQYLNDLQRGFRAKIEMYLAGAQSTSRSTKRSTGRFVAACRALLRAEQRELSAGTARVTIGGQ